MERCKLGHHPRRGHHESERGAIFRIHQQNSKIWDGRIHSQPENGHRPEVHAEHQSDTPSSLSSDSS